MQTRPHTPTIRRGFTLVELLVVMGIIALLISLLVPTVTSSLRKARRTRVQAELVSIGTALDAYKTDFGDYPRFGTDTNDPLNVAADRGARLVCRALMGPAPATDPNFTTAPGDPNYQLDARAYFQDGFGEDGAKVFGFKDQRQVITRNGNSAVLFPGPVRGPYLDPEKFSVRKSSGGLYEPDAVILDSQASGPILYYVARPVQPNLSAPNAIAGTGIVPAPGSLFDAYDNRGSTPASRPPPLPPYPGLSAQRATWDKDSTNRYLYELLGDTDGDGTIGPGESATTTGPYLLIAGGTGGFNLISDPNDAAKTAWVAREAVANVTLPPTK